MKLAAVALLLSAPAVAAPYFRVLDLSRPQISAGAFIDPTDPGNSSVGSMLAVVSHSTRDGCLLPSVTCEDWVPLSVGFAEKNGKAIFAVGPSINLAPLAKSLLLRGFNAVTESGSYAGVKASLGSERLDRQDISVSFGPAWAVAPLENWKGYVRMFMGAAWKF
jgi:hypothetical protein